jgi:hypothetical protein
MKAPIQSKSRRTAPSTPRVSGSSEPQGSGRSKQRRQRLGGILLAMVVAFGATVFGLMWQRRAPAPTATGEVAARPEMTPESMPGEFTPAAESDPRHTSTVAEPPDSIVMSIHNRHRLDSIQGNVQNETNRPLTVLLISKYRDGAIADRRRIEVAAGAQSSFGTEDGMILVPGGTVVAQVAGERDKELKIAL